MKFNNFIMLFDKSLQPCLSIPGALVIRHFAKGSEYNISLNSNLAALDALNDMPIKTVNGAVIRIRDVAQVHDGYQPQQNVVRLDGVRGVLLTILKGGMASALRASQ